MKGAPGYSEKMRAEAKALGITPYELSVWNVPFKADETVLRATPRKSLVHDGVRRLVVAMLEQALDDLREPPAWRRRFAQHNYDPREARAWFYRHDGRPFGFAWVCEVLGLDADAVRKHVTNGGR